MQFFKTSSVVDNWNDRTRAAFNDDLVSRGILLSTEDIDNLLDLFEDKYEVRLVIESKVKGTILSRLLLPVLWVFIGFIVCPINYIVKGRYQLDKKSIWLKIWNKVN